MRQKTDEQIQLSNGNWTTRINPIKRNSKLGFAIRLANKSKRVSGSRTVAYHGRPNPPFFLKNQ